MTPAYSEDVKGKQGTMAKWTVDVVIPTYKPDEKFDRLMQMLQKQTYPIGTILIMNTEKRFFPKKGYETWQKVQLRHIKAEDFDHGGTRDGAASLLSGDLILFMTQDAVPADKYLVERKALPIEGFAKSIKQNYKIAIVADVILSLIVLFVLWSMWISYQMMSGGVLMGRVVFTFGIVILVFLVGYISFVFPTLASYKYGLKELLGISFKLTVVHLPIAILFSVMYLLVILCAYYFWPSLFFTPVLVVLVQRRFLNSIYSKHTK